MLEPRPSNPFGLAMTSPKSLLAAASASAAQTTPVRRDERAPATRARHDRMANAIRALAMDAVEQAKSGHPGLPRGAPDVATVLFTRFLKFDPADPACPHRDPFLLSPRLAPLLPPPPLQLSRPAPPTRPQV